MPENDYEQKHASKSAGLPHQSSSSDYKKKSYDFTDYAYREAVGKLKVMLAESYAPQKYSSSSSIFKSVTDDETDTDQQTIVERPAFKEISKYFPYKPYTPYSTTPSYMHKPLSTLQAPPTDSLIPANAQPPSELLNFIEKQETYIEQLERESNFCRDELSSLLTKVKDVISENETLTDKVKYGISNESSETDDTVETAVMKTSKFTATSGPNILFESRISELEAQLAQTNIDYRKLSEENNEMRRRISQGISGDGILDPKCSDAYKKQVENLQRDKNSLEDTVKKLQKQITDLKESDIKNFSKTQRNVDMAEQANFEKTQAEIEIRRLKDELERQHTRVREIQHEMSKRVAEERSSAERRYTYQVDQLGGDLTSQWEHSSKLQLELERQKRIESDFKRELSQKVAQIDELRNELKMKTTSHLSDLAQINAEKQSLEQEITSLRLQLERCDRQSKVEASRLNAEISSLRQRLDRADADLLHSRRENLRLCDQISSLEKEIALGNLGKDHKPVKDVATIISEMETKHATTVQELEAMIQEQKLLMEKLTDQCKNLTHKLEDTTLKHKEEIDSLQANVEVLTDKINLNAIKDTTSNIDTKITNYSDDLANYQSSPQQQFLDTNNDNYIQDNDDDFNHSNTTNYTNNNTNNDNTMEPSQNLVTATIIPPNSSTDKYLNNEMDDNYYKSTLNTNNVDQTYNDPVSTKQQNPAEWSRQDIAPHTESITPSTNTPAIYGTNDIQQQPEYYGRSQNEYENDAIPTTIPAAGGGSFQQPSYEYNRQQSDDNEWSPKPQSRPASRPPSRPLSRAESRRSITEDHKRQPDSLITTTIEETAIDSTRKTSVRGNDDERNVQYQQQQQQPQQPGLGGTVQQQYEDVSNYEPTNYGQQPIYEQQPQVQAYDGSEYNANDQYSTNEYGQEPSINFQPYEQQQPTEQYSTNAIQPIPEDETFYTEQQRNEQILREQEERERELQEQEERRIQEERFREEQEERERQRIREEEERERQRIREEQEERERQRIREEQEERERQRIREEQEERERQLRIKQEQEQREQELQRKSITPSPSPQSGAASPQPKPPQSPTRNPAAKRGPIKPALDKKGNEQKEGRAAVGEAGSRKAQPEYLQKQPAKTTAARPGAKGK